MACNLEFFTYGLLSYIIRSWFTYYIVIRYEMGFILILFDENNFFYIFLYKLVILKNKILTDSY